MPPCNGSCHETFAARAPEQFAARRRAGHAFPRHFEVGLRTSALKISSCKANGRQAGASLARAHSSSETYWRWLSPHARSLDLWETVYLAGLGRQRPRRQFHARDGPSPFLSCSARTPTPRNFTTRLLNAWPSLTLLSPAVRRSFLSAASFWSRSASHMEIS